jgi:hypothetical protein
MGYRPFIDSPLDSIDIYIYMIDSMILWMWIYLLFFVFYDLFFYYCFGLYEPGGILGVLGPKMCETKVWGVLGGIGGFRGVNPGFTHFGGVLGYFRVGLV